MVDFKKLDESWNSLVQSLHQSEKINKRDILFGAIYTILIAVIPSLFIPGLLYTNNVDIFWTVIVVIVYVSIVVLDIFWAYNYFHRCILDAKIDEFQITQYFNSMSRFIINEQSKLIENQKLEIESLENEVKILKAELK